MLIEIVGVGLSHACITITRDVGMRDLDYTVNVAYTCK